ncbi:PGPGW domain-containing protein [Abyssibacter sp.]|uniref:PGPGW domain-containing protein n=1 Tax=Abyssibacter sp. TaxID=2320200 RepID=UPI000C6A6370|nr:PGPGW domain-containing protein [Abyssibacter sp.]MBB86010.1 hypothetical protein [Xanthomonadales bacterium]MCK5859253.1 hypothetical protein [Abyssibacter sp.]
MSETERKRRGGLREHFAVLGTAEPGRRFLTYHEWRASRVRQRWIRTLYLTLSLLLVPVGILMLVTPGPGLLVLGIALGLVAQASRRWACWLDASENWCRRRIRRNRPG